MTATHRYHIRRIGLQSLAGMGCALGGLAVLAPAVVCGVLARLAVGGLRDLLEGWRSVPLGLVRVDLIPLLHLGDGLATLQALDAAGWWLAATVALAFSLGAGVALALIGVLIGLGYNTLARLSGGLVLELQPTADDEAHGSSR